VALYLSEGQLLGIRSYTLEPYEFRQVGKIFETVTGSDVDGGYAVLSTSSTAGGFFAYASVIDNRTGDPIYITPSMRQRSGGAPAPTPTPIPTGTPTPTPTPPAAQPNLKPYKPSGWTAPLVVSGTKGTTVSGNLVGGMPSYFDWALANFGPGDVFFPAGASVVRLDLDGSGLVAFTAPDGGFTLEEGHYAYYQDYEEDGIAEGQHSGELIGDPDALVAENDENDNRFSDTWTWSHGSPASLQLLPVRRVPATELQVRPLPPGSGPLGAMAPHAAESLGVVYIPAAAHVSGAHGTNWRTDMEIHNPSAVQGRYEVALLRRNEDNTNPTVKTVTIEAGHSLRLEDVLASLFGFSGAAALRVTPISGEAIVTSRTYNLTPDGTYGQFIAGVDARTALTSGERALQIQLSHRPGGGSGFRTNMGLLNCTSTTITVGATFYDHSGAAYGSKSYTLKPFEFIQVDRVFEAVTTADVQDGWVTLTSSAPNARYLAYASIIDNRTGDPIFAPAIPVLAKEPEPVAIRDAADAIMVILGQFGQGPNPSIVDAVTEIQQHGMETFLDGVVSQAPDIITRVPHGVRYNLGDHLVLADGSVVSGSVTWTYDSLVNSGGHLAFDGHLHLEQVLWNGDYPELRDISHHVDVTVAAGVLKGDLSMSGSTVTAMDEMASAASNITGTVHFDTSICGKYPVSGSITVVRDGKEYTITFSDDCDGSFDYGAPGQGGELSFRLMWSTGHDLDLVVKEPGGEVIYWFHPVSATGGRLDATQGNQFCDTKSPNPTEVVSWTTGAPSGTYEFWANNSGMCDEESETASFTIEVYEGSKLRKTFTGTVFDDEQSAHFTWSY